VNAQASLANQIIIFTLTLFGKKSLVMEAKSKYEVRLVFALHTL